MVRFVALSDLHLGAPAGAERTGPVEFIALLTLVARGLRDVDVLVLNGDIYETWSCRMNLPPINPIQALQSRQAAAFHQVILDEKQYRAARGQRLYVVYIVGNHDNFFLQPRFQVAIHNLGLYDFVGESFPSRRILFAHGHSWDLFNFNLPNTQNLGYYIARAAASGRYGLRSTSTWFANEGFQAVLRFVLPEWGFDLIFARPSFWRMICRYLFAVALDRAVWDTDDFMGNRFRGLPRRITIGYVIEEFVTRVMVMRQQYSTAYLANMLFTSIDNFGRWRDYWQRSAHPFASVGHLGIDHIVVGQ